MNDTIPTLGQYRIEKYRQRLERCERALIEERARAGTHRDEQGNRQSWYAMGEVNRQHYRTLAENELVREGLVRPSKERQMEEKS